MFINNYTEALEHIEYVTYTEYQYNELNYIETLEIDERIDYSVNHKFSRTINSITNLLKRKSNVAEIVEYDIPLTLSVMADGDRNRAVTMLIIATLYHLETQEYITSELLMNVIYTDGMFTNDTIQLLLSKIRSQSITNYQFFIRDFPDYKLAS